MRKYPRISRSRPERRAYAKVREEWCGMVGRVDRKLKIQLDPPRWEVVRAFGHRLYRSNGKLPVGKVVSILAAVGLRELHRVALHGYYNDEPMTEPQKLMLRQAVEEWYPETQGTHPLAVSANDSGSGIGGSTPEAFSVPETPVAMDSETLVRQIRALPDSERLALLTEIIEEFVPESNDEPEPEPLPPPEPPPSPEPAPKRTTQQPVYALDPDYSLVGPGARSIPLPMR